MLTLGLSLYGPRKLGAGIPAPDAVFELVSQTGSTATFDVSDSLISGLTGSHVTIDIPDGRITSQNIGTVTLDMT